MENKWQELVPFGTDSEVQLSMTPNDKTRVIQQARHVLKALTVVDQSCQAVGSLSHGVKHVPSRHRNSALQSVDAPSRLVSSCIAKHDMRFPISQKGKATNTVEINPFAKDQGNDDKRNALLSWARENLEGLSIARIGEQMTDLLDTSHRYRRKLFGYLQYELAAEAVDRLEVDEGARIRVCRRQEELYGEDTRARRCCGEQERVHQEFLSG